MKKIHENICSHDSFGWRNTFVVHSFAILFFCVSFQYSLAASSAMVLYEEQKVDETCDDNIEFCDREIVEFYRFEDGGTYEVELGREFNARIFSDEASFDAEGVLYSVPDPDASGTTTRELVAHIGGYDGQETSAFSEPGTYELDVYEVPPPILIQAPLWKRAFSFLLSTAHAQTPELDPDDFIETIHFTVTEAGAVEECCSSVAFLPGIKGSVLKREALIGSDTLWPPTIWSDDVSELALTADGESVNDIFVDGIIEEAGFGPVTESVYDGFVSFMDEVVADGTIADWRPFAYDWRLSLDDVVENGVKTENGTIDLLLELETLAENSDTGQVTIVAHSMGGLLGKALIKKLEEEGKADIIDSFVMVGTPQLGTPQAIASLLHGDGEGIPSNVQFLSSILTNSVVDPATSREVVHSMPSAHALLPSSAYFNDVLDPIITFDTDADATAAWRGIWGESINSYVEMTAFMDGSGDGRSAPEAEDLKSPAVLDSGIIADAESFHSEFDTYTIPKHIRVVQVAGWGLPTAKAIRYTENNDEADYEPVFTIEGDGTVVYPSATLPVSGDDYYLDLEEYRQETASSIAHKDLLNTGPVQGLVRSVVEEEAVDSNAFIMDTKPLVDDSADTILVSSHSPVILGAYDADDNFTGIDIDEERIVEEIPGSSLIIFGDSQYIFVPKEGTYEFEYAGTGEGLTTIKIAEFSGDNETLAASYSNIGTTETTKASFTIESDTPEETVITIDTDNDGTADKTVQPDGEEDSYETLDELIALLKVKVQLVENRGLRHKWKAAVALLERSAERWSRFPFFERFLVHSGERLLQKINEELERQEENGENNGNGHGGWWHKWW